MKGRTRLFKTLFMIVLTLTMGLAIVACGRNTDKADVAEAKEALAIDLKDNSNLDNVTGDLGLPTTGLKDVKVTWTSSNAAVVSTTGTVTRQDDDVTVTLTATLTKGDETDTKPFTVKVIKKETPAVTPEEALAALEVTGEDLNKDEAIYTTTKNVTLPTTSLGLSVNWESSNETALKTDGTVTRPAYGQPNARVILTAYVGSLDKEFIIDVLAFDVMPTVDILSTAKTQLILPSLEVNEDMTLPSQVLVEGVEDEELYTTTVTWASSDTSYITSNGSVTRPQIGEDDVMVTLTASISYDGETVTKDFEVRVLAETTPHETFENFELAEKHFLATATSASDRVYTRINNVSLIGKMEDGLMFTDSEGQVFFAFGSQDNAYRDAETGKLYDIIGLLANYFGVTQINGTGSAWATAPTRLIEKDGDPVEPTVKDVTSIKELLPDTMPTYTFDGNEVVEDRVHNRFTMEYLRVEAKIYVKDVNDTYGTFILDKAYDGDFSDIDASGKTVPYTDEAIVIYYTSNYQELQPLNGLTVTLDVVLYGLRDDRYIFNAVFLGTIDDVLVPDITDEQTVNAVKQSLETSTPTVLTEATTINLPTELLGADIAWTSTNQDIIALDGTVTPINDRVEVTLTAEITKGDATATATIKVMVGELPVLTVQEALAVEKGELLVVKGTIIGYSANNTLVLHDETGAIAIFIGGNVTEEAEADLLKGAIGKVVVLEGQRTEFGGLEQVQHIVKVEVLTEEPHTALTQDITDLAWTAEALLPHQNKLVSITNGVVTNVNVDSNGNVIVTIQIDEKTINIRWDSRIKITGGSNVLETAVEGDIINVINAPLSWTSNNPQIGYYVSNQVTLEADPNLERHTVTFKDGEKTLGTTEVVDGRVILEYPETPIKDGFAFVGWFTDEDVEWKLTDVVEDDLTLNVKWGTEALLVNHEFWNGRYEGNGTGYAAGELSWDETFGTVTANKDRVQINKSNFAPHDDQAMLVFSIRDTHSSAWMEFDFTSYETLTRITFEASVWNQTHFNAATTVPNGLFTLQVNANGSWVNLGENLLSSMVVDKYTEFSFNVDGAGKYRIIYSGESTISGNTTTALTVDNLKLFGLEKELEEPVAITFDLDYEGATKPTVVNIEKGDLVNKPGNPSREGFNFVGWALEGETDVFDFDTPITTDVTLVALWQEIELLSVVDARAATGNVVVQGIVTGIANYESGDVKYIFLSDVDGTTIAVYNPTDANAVLVGDLLKVTGTRATHNGLEQIGAGSTVAVLESDQTVPAATVLTEFPTFTADDQGKRYSFEGLTVVSASGRNLRVTDGTTEVLVYVDINKEALTNHIATAVGKKVDLVNIHLGWYNSAQFLMFNTSEVVIAELTDQDKLDADKAALELAETYTEEFTLPTTGLHGVSITWVADPAANLVDGKLVIPAEDEVTVTLTATLSLEGLEAETKVFNVLLKAPTGDEAELFHETFDDSNATTQYADDTFTGVNGVVWTYVHARDEGDAPIDGKGIMLRRVAEKSSLSATFTSGIGEFSFEYRKAFTGAGARKYAVDVTHNGTTTTYDLPEFGSGSGAQDDIYEFTQELNLEGEVVIKIYATGTAQATFDNFKWTEKA